MRRLSQTVLGLVVVLSGCGADPSLDDPARNEPLRIAAAADLVHALPQLMDAYGDRDGPVSSPTFGASGNLAEQIRAGAPFDVFLSADESFPQELEREGMLVSGSVRPYALGSLVLLVHPSIEAVVTSLEDLVRPEVRTVAIANPDVAPYGKAARQALENAGLWESLASKVVPTGSVSQAFLHVEQGNADAALVSRSLVATSDLKPIAVDPSLHAPRIQALGIVAEGRKLERARRFAEFVLSEQGLRILEDHGFSPPHP